MTISFVIFLCQVVSILVCHAQNATTTGTLGPSFPKGCLMELDGQLITCDGKPSSNCFQVGQDGIPHPCDSELPDGCFMNIGDQLQPCDGKPSTFCFKLGADGTERPCNTTNPPPSFELECIKNDSGSFVPCKFGKDCFVKDNPLMLCEIFQILECITHTTFSQCFTPLKEWCETLDKCKLSHLNCSCEGDMKSTKYADQNYVCMAHQQLNTNTTCSEIPKELHCNKSQTITQVKAIFNILCGVFGILGNGLVILISIIHFHTYSRCHRLITGLAIVDFIFSIFQLVHHIPQLYTCEWIYGYGMCKFLHPTLDLSYMVALGFILFIALERFLGIVHPFSKWLSNTTLLMLVGANIVTGIAFVVPIGYYIKIEQYDNGKKTCEEDWPNDWSALVYSWLQCICYFLLPLSAIGYMYWRIADALKNSKQTILDERQQKKRHENNQRILKILMSITIAFVVLVLPNRLTWLIFDHYGKDKTPQLTHTILILFGFIPYAFHTAINPIIYSIVDKKFRSRLLRLFGISRSRGNKSSITRETTVAFSLHADKKSVMLQKVRAESSLSENSIKETQICSTSLSQNDP